MDIPNPSLRILHFKNISATSDNLYAVRVDISPCGTKYEVIHSYGATKDTFLLDKKVSIHDQPEDAWSACVRQLKLKQKTGYVAIGSPGYSFGLSLNDVLGKMNLAHLAQGAMGPNIITQPKVKKSTTSIVTTTTNAASRRLRAIE